MRYRTGHAIALKPAAVQCMHLSKHALRCTFGRPSQSAASSVVHATQLVHLRNGGLPSLLPRLTLSDLMRALLLLCIHLTSIWKGLCSRGDMTFVHDARIGSAAVLSALLAAHVKCADDQPGLPHTAFGRICSRQDPGLHSHLATAQVSKEASAPWMVFTRASWHHILCGRHALKSFQN